MKAEGWQGGGQCGGEKKGQEEGGFHRQVKYEWPMRNLAYTVLSHLLMPFGVRFSFNFGNTLFNLLPIFESDSHSHCPASLS